jgi:beta-glucosidase/6-phospho-beta-glucosidase/beta-galactosidase
MHPRGLYEMLEFLSERYKKPVIISENNGSKMASGDLDGEIGMFLQNLQFMELAIHSGADVRGYFYWSLTDNIEWNQGSSAHWGMYAVDPSDTSKKRTARSIVPVYAEVCRNRGVTDALKKRYGTASIQTPPTGGVPKSDIFLP